MKEPTESMRNRLPRLIIEGDDVEGSIGHHVVSQSEHLGVDLVLVQLLRVDQSNDHQLALSIGPDGQLPPIASALKVLADFPFRLSHKTLKMSVIKT